MEWAGVVPLLPLNLDFNEDAVDVLPVAPAGMLIREYGMMMDHDEYNDDPKIRHDDPTIRHDD